VRSAARLAADVVIVGIPEEETFTFGASAARRKGLDLRLSRRMAADYPRAIDLVASGRLDPRGIVTHRYPITEGHAAFTTAQRRDGLKVVITPSLRGLVV
jgi:L-iditol 2-dehydrogenase